jgi:hypothetical protein
MLNLKINKQKIIGTFLFLLGISIMIYSGIKLTGFAISGGDVGGFFFLGILFLIGGILLMSFSGQNQLEVKLYREVKKDGKEQIFMTDPENLFGNGTVDLDKFRKDMGEIKKDPELFIMVKEAYFIPLMNKYNGEGDESELAEQYLIEMGFEPEKENEKRYALPKNEILKIKNAFNEKKMKKGITPAQREILKQYKLEYMQGRTHAKITSEDGKEKMIVSVSPSDRRAGKNTSSLLVKLCDKQFRKELQ